MNMDHSFSWPSSPLPTAKNLAFASRLCTSPSMIPGAESFIGESNDQALEPVITSAPFNHAGWSAQDCIKIDSSWEVHGKHQTTSFIVKMPRQHSDHAANACREEALRADWAAAHGLGPQVYAIDEYTGAFVTDFIKGKTLSTEETAEHLTNIIQLLKKLHAQEEMPWMRIYSPVDVVRSYLDIAKDTLTIQDKQDAELIESVIAYTKEMLTKSGKMKLVPCHNDFHSLNIMFGSSRDKSTQLWAIDFENLDKSDPMWDLAYFTVNLQLEPLELAKLYETTPDEQTRLKAYYPLALAHCATWSANHGPQWRQHYLDLMEKLRSCRKSV